AVSMVGSAAAAADRVREKLQALAAHCLEAGPADVALEDGRAWVRGAPHRAVTLGEDARLAYTPTPAGPPPALSAGLEAPADFARDARRRQGHGRGGHARGPRRDRQRRRRRRARTRGARHATPDPRRVARARRRGRRAPALTSLCARSVR